MQAWRAALTIIFLLGAASAASTDLTPLVPAVAVVVMVMLAITNMLAVSLSNPGVEAWAKSEIREFVAGVVLIALVIGMFIASDGVSFALTGEADYVAKSQDVINGWVGRLIATYKDVIEAAQKIRVAASYASGTNIAIWFFSLSYQTSPLSGAALFLVPLSLATQGLTNAIYLCESVKMLVAFFKVVTPKVLLPISFSMRLIPFTRKTGNTLIAISLATIVFLPASVIFADYLNNEIQLPDARIDDLGALDSDPYPIYAFGAICESKFFRILFSMTDPLFALIVCLPIAWIPGAFPACFDLVWHVVYPIMSMVFQIVNAILMITWEAAVNPTSYGEDVFGQLRPFLAELSNLVMVIYLDIVFITLITISGARSISAVIGGDWYMAGVQRLI